MASAKSGRVRIIGGKWKRRIITFPDNRSLRPSPDAVRETLFNWINLDLHGAHCLDLFAGSGVLGFEAVSRGAASAVLVESDARACRSIRESIQVLGAEPEIELYAGRVESFLARTDQKFELVFMDPPFRANLAGKICSILDNHGLCLAGAKVYIESAKSNLPLPIPASWNIIRESTRGSVQSTLVQAT